MTNFRYEIDENNNVRIWDDENPNPEGAPFIFQPHSPTGQPWADAQEAEAWAQDHINLMVEMINNPPPPQEVSMPNPLVINQIPQE